MDENIVRGTITVVKADGPGWLMIAETIENGRYRTVRELCGEEPVTEEIMHFINCLPRRLAAIEGAEVELKKPLPQHVSPRRAARQAAREVAQARDPGRFQPTKSMQFKSAEFDAQNAVEQNYRELFMTVWVRYGKKHNVVLTEQHGGETIVEVTGLAADPDSNRRVAVTLARHYQTTPERVELLHGYSNPKKSFKVLASASIVNV